MAMVMIMVFVLMLKESSSTNMLPMSTCPAIHYIPMYALYCTVGTATHCNSPNVVHCIRCTALHCTLGMNYGALPLCMLTCHSPLTFLLVTLAVIIQIITIPKVIDSIHIIIIIFVIIQSWLNMNMAAEYISCLWIASAMKHQPRKYIYRKLYIIVFCICICIKVCTNSSCWNSLQKSEHFVQGRIAAHCNSHHAAVAWKILKQQLL